MKDKRRRPQQERSILEAHEREGIKKLQYENFGTLEEN